MYTKMIALFGGRFDPVHNGHIAIAHEVLKAVPQVDEIWMVPDNQHDWNPIVASSTDRLAMLHLIETDRIKVSDIGIKVSKMRDGKTFTIDIIRELQEQTKNTYLFIAGSDQLPRLHEWTDYKELLTMLPFLIVPRKGYNLSGELPNNCLWLSDKEFEPMDDSATQIRQRITRGESIDDLVPEKVANYIKEKNLYR